MGSYHEWVTSINEIPSYQVQCLHSYYTAVTYILFSISGSTRIYGYITLIKCFSIPNTSPHNMHLTTILTTALLSLSVSGAALSPRGNTGMNIYMYTGPNCSGTQISFTDVSFGQYYHAGSGYESISITNFGRAPKTATILLLKYNGATGGCDSTVPDGFEYVDNANGCQNLGGKTYTCWEARL
ncbi:hypothetical protein BDD12DRAFT_863535, partial [Trichophaea hybrida]